MSESNGAGSSLRPTEEAETERQDLLRLIKDLAVVHGKVILSSGREADYYIDLRRITLHREAAPLVGRVMRALTADWSYDAAGGLTLGADPVGTAMLHASGGALDSFVVRKAEKQHGMQQRIEGPSVADRSVLEAFRILWQDLPYSSRLVADAEPFTRRAATLALESFAIVRRRRSVKCVRGHQHRGGSGWPSDGMKRARLEGPRNRAGRTEVHVSSIGNRQADSCSIPHRPLVAYLKCG